MNILLISIAEQKQHLAYRALGLEYLAANIGDEDSAELIRFYPSKNTYRSLNKDIAEQGISLVGIQVYTSNAELVMDCAAFIKEHFPKMIVVLGGPHVSVDPVSAYSELSSVSDYMIAGEAERSFAALLDSLRIREKPCAIPGLIVPGEALPSVSHPELIQDLDAIKNPALVFKNKTATTLRSQSISRQGLSDPVYGSIITERGCNGNCKFCCAPELYGNKIRLRSPENVLEEIASMVKKGLSELYIIDDNFAAVPEHASKILDGIISSNYDLRIVFPNGLRIESLDRSLLLKMREAGVYLIYLGLESGSDRVLKMINKPSTEYVRKKLMDFKDSGIDIGAFFILGFPGEKKEEMEETIQFASGLDIKYAIFNRFILLPGSAFSDGSLEKNYLEEEDEKTVSSMLRKAYYAFYIRPKMLMGSIRLISSPRHALLLLIRFLRLLLPNRP